jgi:hypothetical protein
MNRMCPHCGSRRTQMMSTISGLTTETSQTPVARQPLPHGKRRIARKIFALLVLAAWFWVVPAPPNWIEPSRMALRPSAAPGDIPRLLLDNSTVFGLILVALCPLCLLIRDIAYNRRTDAAHPPSRQNRAWCQACESVFETDLAYSGSARSRLADGYVG